LLSGAMPIDHHEEHGEAPKEGDDYPDQFDLGDRLAPLIRYRNLGNLDDPPDDVEHRWHCDAKNQ
jgi:hypothetical protein